MQKEQPIRYLLILILLLALSQAVNCHGAEPPSADWTVMIFMNADNSLDEEAMPDIGEMAKVGSTDKVNILVQLDRLGGDKPTDPDETKTYRYRVTKGTRCDPSNALVKLGESNMGDPAVLKDFVSWAKKTYPAKHYMLEFWSHGQGWRLELIGERMAAIQGQMNFLMGTANLPPMDGHAAGPYRSVSPDDTSGGDQLYVREIEDALAGENIDIIAFDACLMSMIETSYAMRGVGKVMVGSEDLIPGYGFQYDDWLGILNADPSVDANKLGMILVDSYKRTYGIGGGP